MLTFDREDGKTMCLRPDLTVASCISFLQNKSKSKIYYSGQAYRRSSNKGSNFITNQLGIEILGSKNQIQDDLKVISTILSSTKKIKSKIIICVAPDVGGVERARALGKKLDVGLAIVDKRRPSPGKSQVMNVIGNVKNKICILTDDIIDSGGTIVNAADALIKRGAKEVHVYATHGVFSGDAVKKIKSSKIKNLVITDSIDSSDKLKKARNIEVLSISVLLAEAIKRISNSTSVSDLFK